MQIVTQKPDAAVRQLDVAIELLFSEREPLAVRTLAAAAHGVLADLVEAKRPSESWRSRLIDSSGLSQREAVGIFNAASNFLKHADRDADAKLEFDELENDYLVFFATLECGELGHPLSLTMQAFQAWYLACNPKVVDESVELAHAAKLVFPRMDGLRRHEQLLEGARFLPLVRLKFGEMPNPTFQRTASPPLN
jgi:hypothetical protein